MSRKQRGEFTVCVFIISAAFCTFRQCDSVSLAEREHGVTDDRAKAQTGDGQGSVHPNKEGQHSGGEVIIQAAPPLAESDRPGPQEPGPLSAGSPGESLPSLSMMELYETDSNFAQNGLTWSFGNISSHQRPFEDGYQADFPAFQRVPGKVTAPLFDSSHRSSDWQDLRPVLQCDDDIMTFTASGQGLAQLFVDREGAPPISVFQLPPYCGYSVRASWSDLEMMAAYDACYVTQQNGSYVLPMLWGDSPLKLSCPMQTSTPPPSVFCSSYAMAVQMLGGEEDVPKLRVLVNGGEAPFVSADCAQRVNVQPEELFFFISFSATCVTMKDGVHLQLMSDRWGYTLSCPSHPMFPYFPSSPFHPPLSPGDPQSPDIAEPVAPAPTSPPPPPPTPSPPHPGLQQPQLPQVYPPGPQPEHPSQPQYSLYPMAPGQLPYSHSGEHPIYPSPHYYPPQAVEVASDPNLNSAEDRPPHEVSKLPVGPQYPSGLYFPSVQSHYPAVTPAATPTTEKPTTTLDTPPPKTPTGPYYPEFYPQVAYYPAAPVSSEPAPAPLTPLHPLPSPPVQPVAPQYPAEPFYPANPYASYYSYGLNKQPEGSPYSSSPFNPYGHIFSLPPAKAFPGDSHPVEPPVAMAEQAPQQPTCPPHGQTLCNYYPYPYYHPLYPPQCSPFYAPWHQYAQPEPPITTEQPYTPATPTQPPTPQAPRVQCLVDRMVVFLPFAHPDSIQVKDQQTWLSLSSVSPLCGYTLQRVELSGVFLRSPLPACHSQSWTPATNSLPLKFWDLSMMQYRTVDLQCPYQRPPETPAPLLPTGPPIPPSTTKGQVSSPVIPKPHVLCSSSHMTVLLPPGPISGIVVKDLNGSETSLRRVPKHCGYTASKGKNGKIRLSLTMHSHCPMTVQGKKYLINIVYMTVNGKREARLSCPVSIPVSGQECNLRREQRLPCGTGSVSQPHCLSMGCCFSKHPPACHYPMDECTLDRHFVFSVPASLTEPPLSPALLVASGNSTCKPQRVTSDYALFKIPMDGCGARRLEVGKTVIYLIEIVNRIQAITLNYGTITRDSPVRLLVECRFLPGTLLTVGYLVKTPTLGPAIHTQGVFGVQLRIAKDAQYSSYYPQYHQPLQMLLGKPLYLEVRLLNTPDDSLVLLVHYCVAYPRSGKSVWVLLYNGCPNLLDLAPQQTVLLSPPPPPPKSQTRRFTISTFQFLPDGELSDLDEEIYFMCSTEICSPRDSPCVEGCFGQ